LPPVLMTANICPRVRIPDLACDTPIRVARGGRASSSLAG
jgi:hypothetical protein